MRTHQTSRRNFLTTAAILAAGAALANNTAGIFSADNAETDLQRLWKEFCQRQSGENFSGLLLAKKEINPCKGHEYVEGEIVRFAKEEVTAQPIWIYWAGKNKPSDVLINFYKSDNSKTLNQFDLKALCYNKNKLTNVSELFRVGEEGQSVYAFRTTVGANNATSTQSHFV